MHLKKVFRWNKIYIEAVNVILVFRVSLQNDYKTPVITSLNLQARHVSRNKKKSCSHYCNQAPYCMHYARKTDLLQEELNWHKHNRKDFNRQAVESNFNPLHCGKQLHKGACSMQINQIFHDALKKPAPFTK